MTTGHLGAQRSPRDGEAQPMRSQSLRGDQVAWPDTSLAGGALGAAVRHWLAELDSLVEGLRPFLARPGELASVTAREPVMASCYAPGSRYIRHYDNNCDATGQPGDGCNGRRLSAVFYLNESPSDSDGGHLRLVCSRGHTFDVLPELDTLALFWADRRTPHEVLPVTGQRSRFAISCWYVDLAEAPNADAEPMARTSGVVKHVDVDRSCAPLCPTLGSTGATC